MTLGQRGTASDGRWTYHGDLSLRDINGDSLCRTPETNIILSVSYILIEIFKNM